MSLWWILRIFSRHIWTICMNAKNLISTYLDSCIEAIVCELDYVIKRETLLLQCYGWDTTPCYFIVMSYYISEVICILEGEIGTQLLNTAYSQMCNVLCNYCTRSVAVFQLRYHFTYHFSDNRNAVTHKYSNIWSSPLVRSPQWVMALWYACPVSSLPRSRLGDVIANYTPTNVNSMGQSAASIK